MQKVRAYQRAIVIHKLFRVRDTAQYKVVSEEFANEHHHKTNQDPTDIAQKFIEAVRISPIPKIIISGDLLGIQNATDRSCQQLTASQGAGIDPHHIARLCDSLEDFAKITET